MSPRPDRRPDSRPDRAPRRPAGASGSRAGGRPAGSSFRPGGTSSPRWSRPEGSRSEGPGERPRYGREGGSRFSADRSSPDRAGSDRPSPDRERPTGEWKPRERRGGESAGGPARFERSPGRPPLPRRSEEGRFGERPATDRRPTDRSPTDRRPIDRRSSEDRPADARPSERRFSDRRPTDRRPMDRRPADRRPAEGGPPDRDRRPRPAAGRLPAGRPVLFRSAGRGEARPDFGAPPRRPVRDQPRDAAGAPLETDTFSSAAPSDLIWGRHSTQATLESGRPIHRIWCTPEMRFSPRFLQLLRDAKASGVLVEEVTWARLGQISGGAVHQGIVLQPAAAETLDLATLIDGCREIGESPLLLAVDGLTDPQNLGAIVRSAEALGAHGMVLPQRRNAGLTGSVAKVAAGALEHLPVARVVNLNRSLETLKDEGYRVIGLAEEGNISLEEADLDGPLVIVTGSEGDGLSMLTRRNCDQLVRIPLRGATPSLNASVATALLLYEIARRGWMRGLHGTSPAPRLVRPSLPAPAMATPAMPELVAADTEAFDGPEEAREFALDAALDAEAFEADLFSPAAEAADSAQGIEPAGSPLGSPVLASGQEPQLEAEGKPESDAAVIPGAERDAASAVVPDLAAEIAAEAAADEQATEEPQDRPELASQYEAGAPSQDSVPARPDQEPAPLLETEAVLEAPGHHAAPSGAPPQGEEPQWHARIAAEASGPQASAAAESLVDGVSSFAADIQL
ncbi:MAG: 23S rRNA (guanosine(2251)-2'-O)-methyltransferase RlmB [Cyanobacteria bacterium]|nr:23S rRNA (guanosine(2251)-2'-O)-methyltransferase RlmB [Cyanobacteriota bacterium]